MKVEQYLPEFLGALTSGGESAFERVVPVVDRKNPGTKPSAVWRVDNSTELVETYQGVTEGILAEVQIVGREFASVVTADDALRPALQSDPLINVLSGPVDFYQRPPQFFTQGYSRTYTIAYLGE